MKKPLYTAAATDDLRDILDYISKDKPAAADAWIEKIEAKCLLIAQEPEIGELQPHLGPEIRASIVGRYVIFHRIQSDQVEILRIIPGDRDIRSL